MWSTPLWWKNSLGPVLLQGSLFRPTVPSALGLSWSMAVSPNGNDTYQNSLRGRPSVVSVSVKLGPVPTPGGLTTLAQDRGDYYEITGMKNWVTNAREASVAIVFAKTEKTKDHRGISALIVDIPSEGLELIKIEDKLGIKGSSTGQFAFDKVRVPKENLLGPMGKGLSIALATLDGGRIGIAAQALGISRAAFFYAKKYATQRVQFGRPIANLQAIQFMLADMSTKIGASQLLILNAAQKKEARMDYTKDASQAKLFASEAAMWITMKAIQVCGGNGYSREYPLERYFRDAKITEIYEGTSEIQRVVIASHELKDVFQQTVKGL